MLKSISFRNLFLFRTSATFVQCILRIAEKDSLFCHSHLKHMFIEKKYLKRSIKELTHKSGDDTGWLLSNLLFKLIFRLKYYCPQLRYSYSDCLNISSFIVRSFFYFSFINLDIYQPTTSVSSVTRWHQFPKKCRTQYHQKNKKNREKKISGIQKKKINTTLNVVCESYGCDGR